MNVERDIAGFALPFTAGVFVTAYAAGEFGIDKSPISSIALAVILVATAVLLAQNRQMAKPLNSHAITWTLIISAAAACGALAVSTGLNLNIDMPASQLKSLATEAGLRMQSATDSIPFKSPQTGALIKALLTGDRSSLPPEVTKAFRASGASHILALSGLHLGIIYMLVSKTLSLIGNSIQAKRIRSVLVISFCGIYTLATGAGASIVRAFLFILLGETAKLCGRHQSLKQILFASLIIHLTIFPLSAKSVGFQLSYAAIAGIAFIFPWLEGLWPKSGNSVMRWIWKSVALSISCQMTTGPLAYLYFGTFPQYFLLTNLIALPLTGLLIPSALLTLILNSLDLNVLQSCTEWMAYITEAQADLLTWALGIIASM